MTKKKIQRIIKFFNSLWKPKSKLGDLEDAFIEKLMGKGEFINKEDYKVYCDYANVLGVIPKNKFIKKIIDESFDAEGDTSVKRKGSLFNYNQEDFKFEEIVSKYSGELLFKVFEVCKIYENVKIKMKKDYPIWVETEDFICILAPRVEDEEG